MLEENAHMLISGRCNDILLPCSEAETINEKKNMGAKIKNLIKVLKIKLRKYSKRQ